MSCAGTSRHVQRAFCDLASRLPIIASVCSAFQKTIVAVFPPKWPAVGFILPISPDQPNLPHPVSGRPSFPPGGSLLFISGLSFSVLGSLFIVGLSFQGKMMNDE